MVDPYAPLREAMSYDKRCRRNAGLSAGEPVAVGEWLLMSHFAARVGPEVKPASKRRTDSFYRELAKGLAGTAVTVRKCDQCEGGKVVGVLSDHGTPAHVSVQFLDLAMSLGAVSWRATPTRPGAVMWGFDESGEPVVVLAPIVTFTDCYEGRRLDSARTMYRGEGRAQVVDSADLGSDVQEGK